MVGTLLLENPVGQNGLTYQGLLHETGKVFGLRSRRLKLFLDEALTEGKHTGCRFLFTEKANHISFFLA